jgi:hypothetical protein
MTKNMIFTATLFLLATSASAAPCNRFVGPAGTFETSANDLSAVLTTGRQVTVLRRDPMNCNDPNDPIPGCNPNARDFATPNNSVVVTIVGNDAHVLPEMPNGSRGHLIMTCAPVTPLVPPFKR